MERKKSSNLQSLVKTLQTLATFSQKLHLRFLLNSLVDRLLTDKLKIGVVAPIHKKDDLADKNNYCPIVLKKKLIFWRSYDYLEKFLVLSVTITSGLDLRKNINDATSNFIDRLLTSTVQEN